MSSEIKKTYNRLVESSTEFEKRRQENYRPLEKLIVTVLRCHQQLRSNYEFEHPICQWEEDKLVYKLIFHGISNLNTFDVLIYNKKTFFKKEELDRRLELASIYQYTGSISSSFKFYLDGVEDFLEKNSYTIIKLLSEELIALCQKMGVKTQNLDSQYKHQPLSISQETKFAMDAVEEVLKV